jgi:hypothetical protein
VVLGSGFIVEQHLSGLMIWKYHQKTKQGRLEKKKERSYRAMSVGLNILPKEQAQMVNYIPFSTNDNFLSVAQKRK